MTAYCVPLRPLASPTGSRSGYGMSTAGGVEGTHEGPCLPPLPQDGRGDSGCEPPGTRPREPAGIPCVPSSPSSRRASLCVSNQMLATPPDARRAAQTMRPGQTMKPGQSMKRGRSMKRVLIGISACGVRGATRRGRQRRFTTARSARSAPALHRFRRGPHVSAERLGAHSDTSTIPAELSGCWNFGFTWCDHTPQTRGSTRAALYPQRTQRALARGRSA